MWREATVNRAETPSAAFLNQNLGNNYDGPPPESVLELEIVHRFPAFVTRVRRERFAAFMTDAAC